jgi:hypothetical protein
LNTPSHRYLTAREKAIKADWEKVDQLGEKCNDLISSMKQTAGKIDQRLTRLEHSQISQQPSLQYD